MRIFNEKDYRKILYVRALDLKQSHGEAFKLGVIAEECGIQGSYFSRMCRGEAHLNEDQLYLVCEYLKFDQKETEYLNLLFRYQRSSLPVRRKKIKEEIKAFRDRELRTEDMLKTKIVKETATQMDQYFLSPQFQIVHVLLSIDRFNSNPLLIRELLCFSQEQLESVFNSLEGLGLISRSGKRIKVLDQHLFLSKDSFIMPAFHSMMKSNALGRIGSLPASGKYALSVLFSADDEIFDEIREKLATLLKEINQRVIASREETELYQLSIDFFPWT